MRDSDLLQAKSDPSMAWRRRERRQRPSMRVCTLAACLVPPSSALCLQHGAATRTGALRAARDGGAAHEPQGARGGRVARRVRGALERQAAAPDGLCFYGSAGKQLLGDPTLPCPPRRGPRRIVSSPTWCARRSGRSATPSRACCPTTRRWCWRPASGPRATCPRASPEQPSRPNVSYWLLLCAARTT